MRLICLLSIAVMSMALLPLTAFAVPPCSSVDASFCFHDPTCGSREIEWRGSCNNPPDREWRCVWHGCPSPFSDPETGEWTPCCPGGQGVEQCDCLLAGTPITLADGRTKPVEAIQVGDRVLGFDEASKSMKPAVVVSTHAPFETDHYFIINGKIRMTGAHPVLTGGRWVAAGELKVGDPLTDDRGYAQQIFSIQEIDETVPTYNFQVSSGTYVAAGIVVHNKENCQHFMQYPDPN